MHGDATGRRCMVAVSSHGLGHLAQVTPVIHATAELVTKHTLPAIDWTIRTTIAAQSVQARLGMPFELDSGADDFGMVMHDAIHTDLVASLRRYAAFHADWDRRVDTLAQHLQDLAIQALLADVPYLTLAAAARAHIPSLALCSLNWADILLQCVQAQPGTLAEANISLAQFDRIITQISDAYNQAHTFLCPEPSMPMPLLRSCTAVGPVGEPPLPAQREQLLAWAEQHQCDPQGWFVLVSMGGIPTQLNMRDWPTQCLGKPVYYIVAGTQTAETPHCLPAQASNLPYAVLFSSCDLVISKPGYGTFAEAASLSKPLIYIQRPGWPEAVALTAWLDQRGHSRAIAPELLNSSKLEQAMAELLTGTRPAGLTMTGNQTAARHLLALFGDHDLP